MQKQRGNHCQKKQRQVREKSSRKYLQKKRTAGCKEKGKSKKIHLGVVRT